jgi:hypothetical protein
VDLDNIFQFHPGTPEKNAKYEKLRAAHHAYAKALIGVKSLNEDDDLNRELAYEDLVRVYTELLFDESPEVDRALHYINEAYRIAEDPNRAIVQAVQSASMFANAAVALKND